MKTKRNKLYGRDRSLEGSQYTFAWRTVRNRTVSVEQAAEKMGVSADTVRRMVKTGELLGVPLREGVKGSPVRISLDTVEDYVCKQLDAYGMTDADVSRSPGLPQTQQPPRR